MYNNNQEDVLNKKKETVALPHCKCIVKLQYDTNPRICSFF